MLAEAAVDCCYCCWDVPKLFRSIVCFLTRLQSSVVDTGCSGFGIADIERTLFDQWLSLVDSLAICVSLPSCSLLLSHRHQSSVFVKQN